MMATSSSQVSSGKSTRRLSSTKKKSHRRGSLSSFQRSPEDVESIGHAACDGDGILRTSQEEGDDEHLLENQSDSPNSLDPNHRRRKRRRRNNIDHRRPLSKADPDDDSTRKGDNDDDGTESIQQRTGSSLLRMDDGRVKKPATTVTEGDKLPITASTKSRHLPSGNDDRRRTGNPNRRILPLQDLSPDASSAHDSETPLLTSTFPLALVKTLILPPPLPLESNHAQSTSLPLDSIARSVENVATTTEPAALTTRRITPDAVQACGELLRLFLLETCHRASIEAECDYEEETEDLEFPSLEAPRVVDRKSVLTMSENGQHPHNPSDSHPATNATSIKHIPIRPDHITKVAAGILMDFA